MDHRLHRALDENAARDELTPALAAELDHTRALLDSVVRAIPVRPLPSLGADVMRRITAAERTTSPLRLDAQSPPPRRNVAAWLWSRHEVSLSFRPAHALAAATLVVAAALGLARTGDRTGDRIVMPAAVAGAERAAVLVEFRLAAPDAQRVMLAGAFSDWSPAYTMTRSAPGVWTVVVPLAPGVHEYAFVVDGKHWVPDPAAPGNPDGFGGVNSRVAVLSPDVRS